MRTDFDGTQVSNSVVYFSAQAWCQPCKLLHPIIDSLAEQYSDNFNFFDVDVDDNSELAVKYKVSSVPTVVLLIGGEEKKRLIGANPRRIYESMLDENTGKEGENPE